MTNTAGNLLDSVIGEDTHLADTDLQALLQFASLDAMRRAVALGLGVEGAQVLQALLMLWQQRPVSRRSQAPYIVATLDAHLEDLTGLDTVRVHEGLRQLIGFVRVDDLELYLSGDIELSLEPLLNGGDGDLGARLDRFWRVSHVSRRLEAMVEADEAIDTYLSQAEARVPLAGREWLAMLQARWRRFEENRRFKAPFNAHEVVDHLSAFELEVAELEAIHDGLTGLLGRTCEYPVLFAERHPVSTGSRLQAMRARSHITMRPVIKGRDRLVVIK
jgi:hypothetical protein